jgi:hypothetical protein
MITTLRQKVNRLERLIPLANPVRRAMRQALEDYTDAHEAYQRGEVDDDTLAVWLTRWVMSLGGRPVPTFEEAKKVCERC